MRFLLFALVLLPLSSGMAFSQETWTRFNKTNQITDISVHGDDIWCATTGGLVRWNKRTGVYQEILPRNNSAFNIVTTIEAAPDGTIWGIIRGDTIVLDNMYPFLKSHPPTCLVHYDGRSWSEYDAPWTPGLIKQGDPEPKSATALAVDREGTVWVGISYDISTMGGSLSAGYGFSSFKNGQWSTTPLGQWSYDTRELGRNHLISSIVVGTNGMLWVNTAGAGIFQFDGQTLRGEEGSGPGTLYIGPDETVWLIGLQTIQHRIGETWVSLTIPREFLSGNISTFACDTNNRLWIGTNDGLIHYDGSVWKRYTAADGLVDNSISSLATDDSGILWIGTTNGLVSFDGVSFHSYRVEDRLINENVHILALEPNGTAWAGTSTGISRYNGRTWRSFTTKNGLPDSTINAIAITPKGDVWIGTPKGAARYYGSGWKAYSTEDGLASNTVYAITSGKDGQVLFGTGNGVSCYDGTKWRTYGPSTEIRYLVGAPDGTVWAASSYPEQTKSNTIFHLTENRWVSYKSLNQYNSWIAGLALTNAGSVYIAYQQGITDNSGSRYFQIMRIDSTPEEVILGGSGEIFCFTTAPDSTIWFATTRRYGGFYSQLTSSPGLHRVKEGASTVFTISDGLSSSVVKAIAIAPDGAVWCGTDKGLSRYGKPMTTGVESEPALPKEFAVVGNYPNPFNPSTAISFTLPRAARVELAVYSITGQKVRTILSGPLSAGTHSVVWDGKDDSGKAVSSGVYITRLRSGKQVAGHKMLFMK